MTAMLPFSKQSEEAIYAVDAGLTRQQPRQFKAQSVRMVRLVSTLVSPCDFSYPTFRMCRVAVLVGLLFVTCHATGSPGFWVTFPGVIPGGSETTVCANLFHPNETLSMTVALIHNDQKRVLFQRRVNQDFSQCFQFQAPLVTEHSEQNIEVEVGGADFRMEKKSKVLFTPVSFTTFIQTDKPVYIKGQTVHIRIFTVDMNLNPVNQLYDRVELQSPIGHIIGQWINTTSNGSVLQLSFPLNSKPSSGQYELNVWSGNQKTAENFEVQNYVLPRFKMELNVPKKVNVIEKEVKIVVCGKYTNGKPLAGMALLVLCRDVHQFIVKENKTNICQKEDIPADKMGCAFKVFNMSFFMKDSTDFKDFLRFTVKLEEEETGIVQEESGEIMYNNTAGRLLFVDTPTVFHYNSSFEGKIKAVDFRNLPIANIPVYLHENFWWGNLLMNATTDINGVASFSINTTLWSHSYVLCARISVAEVFQGKGQIFFEDALLSLSLWQPSSQEPSKQAIFHSSLTLLPVEDTLTCRSEQQFRFQYTIFEETSESGTVDLNYLVLFRQAIAYHGRITVTLQEGSVTKGEASIQVNLTPDLAPKGQLLVYSLLPSKILIANSTRFKVENCLRNKVSLEFSHSQAVTGEKVDLQLKAHPGSVCGLSVVEKSLLLKSDNRLNANKIFSKPLHERQEGQHWIWMERIKCVPVRAARSVQDNYVSDISEASIRTFWDLGLKTVSSLPDQHPECVTLLGRQYLQNHPRMIYLDDGEYTSSSAAEEVRSMLFLETWVWDLVEVGESGSSLIHLTAPDTITSWETEAFCLSKGGMGLATPLSLSVFQPFIMDLTLPHSIILGEHFELKATLVNHEPKCIMVTVSPALSSDYTLEPIATEEYSTCLCQWKTFRWTLVPSVIGSVNVTVRAEAIQSETVCDNEVVSVPEKGHVTTVTRSLLVKAEGIEKTTSRSWLLCPKETLLKMEAVLEIPANVVEGSARASVSVMGDILGRAIQNLDTMLAMPYGCGEQNMARMASNIYILHYLSATQQLTPVLLQEATLYLKTGYQGQLKYLHVNGAFSTFGTGTEVNSWLTAFIMRSLGRARPFVYVNPKVIDEARDWLQSQQKEDGCFKTVGTLFNKRMKGGVVDDVTLTAYIAASMLELNMSVSRPALARSLTCLREASYKLNNIYTAALLAYTFSLAQEMDTHSRLLKYLDSVASTEDGFLHWSPPSSEDSTSLAIEMTAYVLLAVLSQPRLSASNQGYADRIVGWLVKQQNPQGGFFSTQDTVVALQALSQYATLVYNPGGASTVTVRSSSGETHHFTVDQTNKLTYQERKLHNIPGQYVIEAQGTACVSVQTTLYYNIPPTPDVSSFGITASTKGNCSRSGRDLLFNLHLVYNGPRNTTDMVIVDVAMLSGFFPELENVKQLEESLKVDHAEIENNHVLLYFKKLLQNNATEISFRIKGDLQVENMKPAMVKVYDYYQPSDHAVTKYTSVCIKDQ